MKHLEKILLWRASQLHRRRRLEARKHPILHRLPVLDLLEKKAVLGDAGGAERVGLAPDGHDELVVRKHQLAARDLALDRLLIKVNLLARRLDVPATDGTSTRRAEKYTDA
eukprot:1366030-Pleurochrysis_carterae.AAC.4